MSIEASPIEANRRKNIIRQSQRDVDLETERKKEFQKQGKKNESCKFIINRTNQLVRKLEKQFKTKMIKRMHRDFNVLLGAACYHLNVQTWNYNTNRNNM